MNKNNFIKLFTHETICKKKKISKHYQHVHYALIRISKINSNPISNEKKGRKYKHLTYLFAEVLQFKL